MRLHEAVATVLAIGLVTAACSTPPVGDPEPSGVAPPREDTVTPPDVDVTIHDVPLDEIYFDTFDGRSVTLPDSTAELRFRLLDAIPPIDAPVYGGIEAGAWLEDDDPVLGYVSNGQAYAYPFKILNFHEIVNDVIDGVPVLISYCPLCRSAIVYDRRIGGEVLSFGNTSALYESDLVMVDRNTGSYWWQVAGRAIIGPLTGTQLELLPSAVSTWDEWKENHRETLVLTRETGFERPYQLDSFATYADSVNGGRFAFPVGENARDRRLLPAATVVGVSRNGETRAYPLERLLGPTNDVVGGQPIVVLPTRGGAAVFESTVDGVTLDFASREGELVDENTGSTWTTDGMATSGPLAGTELNRVPARTTYWFALVGAFPDIEVYGGP